MPVEVRWGDADTTNPFDRDVLPFLDLIPGAGGAEVGPGVDHPDFIEPFTPDRPAARERVTSDAVRFFDRQLRSRDGLRGPTAYPDSAPLPRTRSQTKM